MSKEIAQTVGGKTIAYLIAIVAALAAVATYLSQAHAADPPTPKPAILSIVKEASVSAPSDGIVSFTITVENSGGTSATVEVLDQLPGDALWLLASNTLGCSLDGEFGAQIVNCSDTVEARHLNASGDDFENGRGVVSVWALAGGCGRVYRNQASLSHGDAAYASNVVYASTVSCPTVVPSTPTPAPTQTTAPSSTPTNLPSATSTQAIAPSASITPLPPRTGDSPGESNDSSRYYGGGLCLVGASLVILGAYVLYRQSRR